jgi:hypothetical protein
MSLGKKKDVFVSRTKARTLKLRHRALVVAREEAKERRSEEKERRDRVEFLHVYRFL